MFYVKPKMIFGQHEAEFDSPSLELKNVFIPGLSYIQLGFWRPTTYVINGLQSKKSGLFGALAIGIDFYENFGLPLRLELEISSRIDDKVRGNRVRVVNDPTPYSQFLDLEPESLSYSLHTAYLNLFFDWHNNSRFRPYIGGGIGLAYKKGKASVWSEGGLISSPFGHHSENDRMGFQIAVGQPTAVFNSRSTDLAWHFDVGISFLITDSASIDLSYRYADIGKPLNLSGDPKVKVWRNEYFNSSNGVGTEPDVDIILRGPKEIKFKTVQQFTLGLKYSFF
jgi:opacity protein-like surface antigen